MAGSVTNMKHHPENPPEKSIKSTKKSRPLNTWKQHLAKDNDRAYLEAAGEAGTGGWPQLFKAWITLSNR